MLRFSIREQLVTEERELEGNAAGSFCINHGMKNYTHSCNQEKYSATLTGQKQKSHATRIAPAGAQHSLPALNNIKATYTNADHATRFRTGRKRQLDNGRSSLCWFYYGAASAPATDLFCKVIHPPRSSRRWKADMFSRPGKFRGQARPRYFRTKERILQAQLLCIICTKFPCLNCGYTIATEQYNINASKVYSCFKGLQAIFTN